jgi:hypothetical protein
MQRKKFAPKADRPMEEQAKERERIGGGLGGLSGAGHQMPAGERPAQAIVGVGSVGEAAALLEPRRILRQLSELRGKPTVIEHASITQRGAKRTAQSRLRGAKRCRKSAVFRIGAPLGWAWLRNRQRAPARPRRIG